MPKNQLILDRERGCTNCANVDGCLLRQRIWDELIKLKGFVSATKTGPVFVAVGNGCKANHQGD